MQRYSLYRGAMHPCEHGEYVKHADAEKIKSDFITASKSLEKLKRHKSRLLEVGNKNCAACWEDALAREDAEIEAKSQACLN